MLYKSATQFSGWIDFRIELGGPSRSKSGWFRSGWPQMVYNPGLTQSYSELIPNEPKKVEPFKNGLVFMLLTKVSFFVQCIKKQLIRLQNFNIQTCFSQFLWFFSLKFWFKGQIISRIHLILPNAYISMEIGMLNFWSVIICLCNGPWN